MLQNIRENTQGTMAKIIIAIICIPFVLFGVESLFGTGGVTSVAKVNGEKITAQELNEEIYFQKQRLIAQMGDNIDPGKLDDNKLKEPALNALVDRKILLQLAAENKMSIADKQITQLIVQNPDFQEDGQFTNDRFQAVLGRVGMTVSTYKRLFKRDLLLNQLSSGITSSGFITDKEIAVNTRFTHQTRDIRYITLNLEKEKESVTVSPEEVREYYDNNPGDFQSEETVVAEYIELKQSDFNKDIDEAEVKAAYEKEVARFDSSDYREVAHILVEVNDDTSKEQAGAKLIAIKKQIAEGESFADLAKEHSDDFGSKEQGGALGELNEDAFPEAFVQAAKALTKGQVSDIVETESGFHIIKLTELTVTKAEPYEKRKDILIKELQSAKAAPAFWAAVEELKDISFNAPDLQEPAEVLKIDVKESMPVKRSGGEGLFSNPSVYKALFANELINEKQNSEVIQIRPDHVVVVHVKSHAPAKLIPFENAGDQAKQAALIEKATKLLAEKAEKIQLAIQSGAEIEKVANENAHEWQVHLATRRTAAEVDRLLLNAAFQLPKAAEGYRAVDTIKSPKGDYIVFVVENVKDGRPEDVSSMEISAIKNYMSQSAGLKEFKAVESYVKSEADIDRL